MWSGGGAGDGQAVIDGESGGAEQAEDERE